MRSEAGVKAEKKSNRIAAEGVVHYFSNDKKALLIEINSETDFVAKGDDFLGFVNKACQIIINQPYHTLSELTESAETEIKIELDELRKNFITKLGENIQIRRFEIINKDKSSVTGYTHNNKIGAMVVLKSEDEQLSKDICMQIVASSPLALDEKAIDKEILDNERDVYHAELENIDKKDDIKRNILEGKIKKFISENTLLNQPFIKDGSLTLKNILKDNEILSYTRYQLGEGIDKKQEDFAQEVYSQIK